MSDLLPDSHAAYLIAGFVLSLVVIYYGGFASRLAVLCFTVAVGGLVLNAQYSAEQMAALADMLGIEHVHLALNGAKAIATGITLFWNFAANRLWTFKHVQ